MINKYISVIQNHILFDDERGRKRLEHQMSHKGIPSFGKIFEDCDFFVNYKTKTFLEEIKETYEKYIKNVNLYNNLDNNNKEEFMLLLYKGLVEEEKKSIVLGYGRRELVNCVYNVVNYLVEGGIDEQKIIIEL